MLILQTMTLKSCGPRGRHRHAVKHKCAPFSQGPKNTGVLPQAVLPSDLLTPTSNQSAAIKVRVNLENQSLRSQEADGQPPGLQGKTRALTSAPL